MLFRSLGAVQIVRDPGYFSYAAALAGEYAFEGPPTPDDTRVPQKEREAFHAVATELGLTPARGDEAVTQVKQFFANGYRYATYQKDVPLVGSPIVDFLHRSKSGHCEYFATATALLLRAGGIPARYATGFVVTEKSERENAWIVRTRHAHAWVRAYVNGAWIDIDTTPPTWLTIEAEDSSAFSKAWSAVSDLGSWLHFRVAQAWANSDERKLLTSAMIVVFPFALWLAWRLYRSRSTLKNSQQKQIVTILFPDGRPWAAYSKSIKPPSAKRPDHALPPMWASGMRYAAFTPRPLRHAYAATARAAFPSTPRAGAAKPAKVRACEIGRAHV